VSLLPDVRTTQNAAQVRRVFITILLELKLSVADLAKAYPVFMAQSALETAHWNSMHCWNWGNIRPGAGWTGDIVQMRCNEQFSPGKWTWFNPPAPGEPCYGDPRHGSSFRAFTGAVLGARDYFGFIQKHYPEAYSAALGGDAALFVHGLKARGYFTADEAPYRNAVVSLVSGFAKLQDDPLYVTPAFDWSAFPAMKAAAINLDIDASYANLDLSHDQESGEAYHENDS